MSTETAGLTVPKRFAIELNVQRFLSHLNFIWFGPLFLILLYGVGRYRCRNLGPLRARVREILAAAGDAPMIICANHLTMIDSMLITAYIFPVRSFLFQFRRFPWNVPEISNFGKNILLRFMCYLGKCVFVARQGSVQSKKQTWDKIRYLIQQGELVCIFPEGGRSRSGRVEPENAVYGIGHLVQDFPGCHILNVYLRGEGQETYSFIPKRGERFQVAVESLQPSSPYPGRRGAREITLAIMNALKTLEEHTFAGPITPSIQ